MRWISRAESGGGSGGGVAVWEGIDVGRERNSGLGEVQRKDLEGVGR